MIWDYDYPEVLSTMIEVFALSSSYIAVRQSIEGWSLGRDVGGGKGEDLQSIEGWEGGMCTVAHRQSIEGWALGSRGEDVHCRETPDTSH